MSVLNIYAVYVFENFKYKNVAKADDYLDKLEIDMNKVS